MRGAIAVVVLADIRVLPHLRIFRGSSALPSRRASLLPIAVHESVKGRVPKPIGRNATDGTIVGQESVGLFLREHRFGIQADAGGVDYRSIGCRLDNRRTLSTTSEQRRSRCARTQVIPHVGVTRKRL